MARKTTHNLKPAWKKGVSGNPKGRPKGSRNKLSDQFLKDLTADWNASGKDAIEKARTKDPVAYVKTVASILPKNILLDATMKPDDAFLEIWRQLGNKSAPDEQEEEEEDAS